MTQMTLNLIKEALKKNYYYPGCNSFKCRIVEAFSGLEMRVPL
jgi:hypothetical protein